MAAASGMRTATVGATVLVGGIVMTTTTGGEVPRAPFASTATAVRMFVPKGAFQRPKKGALSSCANSMPLARNWTLVTPVMALAVAVTKRFVGPSMMAPSAGLGIAATGGPSAS